MKRATTIALFLIAIVVGVWLYRQNERRSGETGPDTAAVGTSSAIASVTGTQDVGPAGVTGEGQRSLLIGEQILIGYADRSLPPENDLILLSRLMDNFLLLVKSAADRPLSANEEWAAALRGVNRASEPFLPDNHIALNEQGQLIDRWGSPLFFHALGEKRFEIRSAGPDAMLWTGDDLHRNADGSFRRGEALHTSDLFGTATPED